MDTFVELYCSRHPQASLLASEKLKTEKKHHTRVCFICSRIPFSPKTAERWGIIIRNERPFLLGKKNGVPTDYEYHDWVSYQFCLL